MRPLQRRQMTALMGGASAPRLAPNAISGLKLWLDASQIVGLNDGDSVTTWSDLSGNGYDATQGTASKKPVYKTAILNGLAVVRFDGVDDVLTSTFALAGGAKTLVIIAKLSGGSVNYPRVMSGVPDTTYFVGCASTGKNVATLFGNGAGAWNDVNANSPTASWNAVWNIVAARTDGTTLTPRVNATTQNTKSGTNATALTAHDVGGVSTGAGPQWWTGDVFAVCAYDNDIGSANLAALFNYYNAITAIY